MFCKQLAGNHVPHQDHIRGVFPAISLKLLNHPTKPFFASAPIAGHDGDGDGDDDVGYPAYSHHDKIPPWWECVSNDKGGNVTVSKSYHT